MQTMIQPIPEYFSTKAARMYGAGGAHWLAELPQWIACCAEKWRLTNLRYASGMTVNLICFAQSPEYGEVVLKLEGPHPEAESELRALQLYEGRHICRCLDADQRYRALLLERIAPGDCLADLGDPARQLAAGAELCAKLPIAVPAEAAAAIPAYAERMDKAFRRARAEQKVGRRMLGYMEAAERVLADLQAPERPQMLLHGDLHHWNILRDSVRESGGWKAIDPQGVMGPACLESARFIDNYIDIDSLTDKRAALDEAVTVFAAQFGESKETIAACVLVLRVLSTCWTFEEANPEQEQLEAGIAGCTLAYEYWAACR